MNKIRNVFPGGNTCYGFYSFYDYMVNDKALRKIILKGGPGIGKSTLMKAIGQELSNRGLAVEYHWCSSDTDSLDGVVVEEKVCILDGTSPHLVDPRYPGVYDEILNLGKYWNRDQLLTHKEKILDLTKQKSGWFRRAYNRLRETQIALGEWKSYYEDAIELSNLRHNLLALQEDFLQDSPRNESSPRHLFAAAISPAGISCSIDSLIDGDFSLFVVKGSPGSGVKTILQNTLEQIKSSGIHAEVFHCPFDPKEIDLIILPRSKKALLDISGHIVDYEKHLLFKKYKRLLDFDQFADASIIENYRQFIKKAQHRFQSGLQEAIHLIANAKQCHYELESYYIPSMDFAAMTACREKLLEEIVLTLNQSQDF